MKISNVLRGLSTLVLVTIVSGWLPAIPAQAVTIISTCGQFEAIDPMGGSYVLGADLNCTLEGNDIIVGDEVNPFQGVLHGGNHTITVAIDVDGPDYVGLFARLNGASITSLTIAGSVRGSGQYVGSLAGDASEGTVINHVTSTAAVAGFSEVGGLVGSVVGLSSADRASISNSAFNGTIAMYDTDENLQSIGGLVGYAQHVYLVGNTVTADINVSADEDHEVSSVGGLLGYLEDDIMAAANETNVTITAGSALQHVHSFDSIGGMVGYSGNDFTMEENTAAGTIQGYADSGGFNIGGFAGVLCDNGGGCIVNSDSSSVDINLAGNVSDNISSIGGFVGYFDGSDFDEVTTSTTCTNLTATGDVTIQGNGTIDMHSIGGVVGEGYNLLLDGLNATGAITISPIAHAVFEVSSVGGFVGYAQNVLITGSDSSDAGDIDIEADTVSDVGGAVGYAEEMATINVTNVDRAIHINLEEVGTSIDGIGGLVGYADAADISVDVFTSGDMLVSGEGSTDSVSNVGGVIGYVDANGNIDDVRSDRDISIQAAHDTSGVGGIAGTFCNGTYDCILRSVAQEGEVNIEAPAVSQVGGLAGYMDSGEGDRSVQHSYSDGDIHVYVLSGGETGSIGGLLGYASNASMYDSYKAGDISVEVSGEDASAVGYIGGVAGYLDTSEPLAQLYYAGEISISANADTELISVGGLFGEASINDLSHSFASNTFDITGPAEPALGGLFGHVEYDTLTGNYYGSSSGDLDCSGTGLEDEGCMQVDNTGEFSDAFFHYANVPFTIEGEGQWNTGMVWYFSEDAYPVLLWSIDPPSVTTTDVDGITSTSATLHGSLDDNGGAPATEYGFDYGRIDDEDYDSTISEMGEGPYDEGDYEMTVSELTCGTEYRYRFYAVNFMDTGHGEDGTFTTAACAGGGSHRDPNDPAYLSPTYDPPASGATPSVPTDSGDTSTGQTPLLALPPMGPSPWDGHMEPVDTVTAGTYVKGTHYDTIYYVTQDGDHLVRRPFINEAIFATYEDSFSVVHTVTDATLPFLKLGSPMLPKPGSVFVKLESVAKTYATFLGTTPKPVARWIQTESDATTFAGPQWADYVIDIPVTLYQGYEMGADLVKADAGLINRGLLRLRASLNIK